VLCILLLLSYYLYIIYRLYKQLTLRDNRIYSLQYKEGLSNVLSTSSISFFPFLVSFLLLKSLRVEPVLSLLVLLGFFPLISLYGELVGISLISLISLIFLFLFSQRIPKMTIPYLNPLKHHQRRGI